MKRLLLVAAAAVLTSCSLGHQDAPSLTGPSETALSLSMTASPDTVTWDGVSQSVITVTAFDAHSQPMKGLTLRAQTEVGGTAADFGRLSSSTFSTDSSGHASFIYTAPAQPAATISGDQDIDIRVLPVGTNFQNNSGGQTVGIHLALPSVIQPGPPQGTPVAKFTFSPIAPRENDTILFDASASTAGTSAAGPGQVVSYAWTFGDGGSATGVRPGYRYDLAGTYNVSLTVTDNRGQSATTSAPVTVSAGADPSLVITVSPKSPIAGQAVNMTAAGSKASPGHTINNYEWDFGDGTPHGSGLSTSHTYAKAGGYSVVLTVTDDQGRSTSGSADVTVLTSGPTASFTNTSVSLTASFNGAGSSAIDGRTITAYAWDFGDGSTGSNVTTTHTYAAGGSFTVTLKVTDSAGQTGTIARTITITP